MWVSEGLRGKGALDYGVCQSTQTYLGGSDPHTMIVKFKTTDTTEYGTLFGFYHDDATVALLIQIHVGSLRLFKCSIGGITADNGFNDGNWHTAAMVDDGMVTETMDVYVDGAFNETLNHCNFNNSLDTAQKLILLGHDVDYIPEATIEYVALYSRMLSSGEITWITADPYAMFRSASNVPYFFLSAGGNDC